MAEPASSVPGRIFISYRREETAYPAGWLFDRLGAKFGGGQVFKDVDSIELGDDFVDKITTAVGSCDVLLALIGDQWLTITDERGRRRIDDPDDFVRLEVEAALTRKVRVIPVLVDGARMPRADELPPTLAGLARRQALELNPSRFDFDTSRLVKALEKTLAEVQVRPPASGSQPAADTPDPRTPGPLETPKQGEQVGVSRGRGVPPTAIATSDERLPRASWLRRHPRLSISAVAIGLAGLVAVIVAASDNKGAESSIEGAESSRGVSAAFAKAIPDTIASSCQRATGKDAWMVGDDGWGATEQRDCQSGAISYGVFSSATTARDNLIGAYNFTLRDEAKSCDRATETQMTAVKGQWKGTTRCSIGIVDGKNAGDLSIYWNEEGSRVDGLLYVGADTRRHDVVEDWAELISAH